MRVCGSILLIATIGLAPGSGLAQDNLPAAPSATREQTREQRKPQSPPAADPAKTDNSTQQEQSNVAPKPADVSAASRTSSGPTADEDAATTIRVPVNEVNVIFTVTDKHGRYVKNLKKSDFNVVDDSKPAAEIRSFHNETDLPLQIGLLVDASNSVRDRFKFEQESAIEFLSQTIRPKFDKGFVVGFDATPEVTQDFTDSTEALSRGVRMLRPGGGTAMYDAIYFACRDKLAKQARTGPMRFALVVLSDGDDNQSHVTREEALEMAQRAEVIIYSISTNITGSKNDGDKILRYMSETTGGRAFFPFQITDVANAFAEIQEELRSQYALSYHPSTFAADGRYHTIQILAQERKGLKV